METWALAHGKRTESTIYYPLCTVDSHFFFIEFSFVFLATQIQVENPSFFHCQKVMPALLMISPQSRSVRLSFP